MYHYFVKKLVKQLFKLLNEHNYTQLTKPLASDVKHTFSGDHALVGVRHDLTAFKLWLERLGRIMPKLHINVISIVVKVWPNNTLAIARWIGTTATLETVIITLTRG